mmetsp:Transcript_25963/g.82708  ORF Transcript_25963/g.82708 Transcript_25963/m.82708 type:complete len:127 (-) Transcript_25963:36-416(-)
MAQRSEESGWAKWLMRGIAADDTDKDKEIRSCTEESMTRGFWWGLGATALAFVAVEGGVKYLNSHGARANRMGFTGSVSGRALAVTGLGLGTFFLVSEQNMQACKRRHTVFKDYMGEWDHKKARVP